MSRGIPLVPIFDEEGILSIRIMSLVPLVKVGFIAFLFIIFFSSVQQATENI
jgi:hypothetical protein